MQRYSATPVVRRGVLYAQDLSSNVLAINFATGALIWRKTYDDAIIGPNGVSVDGGRVFGATKTKAFALDAKTGAELWSRPLILHPYEGIDMAPGYHDGTVYLSTVPVRPDAIYVPQTRGVLWALDAATGRPRWSWDTVPRALWGHPEFNSGGGVWRTPAFDGQGSLYVGTANPAPFPGIPGRPWGESRPGPNTWTDSVVKLDEHSGRMVWGRQLVPHDLYDWDVAAPVILASVGSRPIVVAGGKMGYVFAFDQRSGALLWKTSVGMHNGHDDDDLKAMRGEGSKLRRSPNVLPGVYGGILTEMAVDRERVYAAVVDEGSVYKPGLMASQKPLSAARGEFVAIDLATGRVTWVRKLPSAALGGATVANDLVFTSTYDGTVRAFDTATGRPAWNLRLPSGTASNVAIVGSTLLVAGEDRAGTSLYAYRLRRHGG